MQRAIQMELGLESAWPSRTTSADGLGAVALSMSRIDRNRRGLGGAIGAGRSGTHQDGEVRVVGSCIRCFFL